MRPLFRGKHRVKVDGKGRMSVPPGFRRALEAGDPAAAAGAPATVYVSHEPGKVDLYAMTVAYMERLTAQVEAMHDGDPNREALEEYLYENVEELQLDATHRITLPRHLRDAVGLGAEAILGGRGQRFRIYSPEAPTPAASMINQQMDKRPEGYSVLSLLPGLEVPPSGREDA